MAVPLNYRLTPEEAAYVIDNSDARVVYVDAEYEELIARARDRLPKVEHVCVFGGDGQLEEQVATFSELPPADDGAEGIAGADHDLHVGDHR